MKFNKKYTFFTNRKILHFLIITVIVTGIFFAISKFKTPTLKNSPQLSSQLTKISGATMGTTYHITLVRTPPNSEKKLAVEIKKILDSINQSLSTWIDESEISKLGRNKSKDCIPVSKELMDNLVISHYINKESNNSFNIYISKLIDMWGFDKMGRVLKAPTAIKIAMSLQGINSAKITLIKDKNCVLKSNHNVRINLSGIAKGFAIDKVALYFNSVNIDNYLIEIGGEVRSNGLKPNEGKWKIGIETPNYNQTANTNNHSLSAIVKLDNMAVATSGDYRNFFMEKGERYSHIIDPKTGYPIANNVASVSVVVPLEYAKNNNIESNDSFQNITAIADSWATAFAVMGAVKALKIANSKRIGIMLIVEEKNKFKILTNKIWDSFLQKN